MVQRSLRWGSTAAPCCAMRCAMLTAEPPNSSELHYKVQLHCSSNGHCSGLCPPAPFPGSQAKSRAPYHQRKMCHLCCISFPFPHLFPAHCASEITAPRADAAVRSSNGPSSPIASWLSREQIRKFAEIFGQQNKHFSCQASNRQLRQAAAICMAPLTAPFQSALCYQPWDALSVGAL